MLGHLKEIPYFAPYSARRTSSKSTQRPNRPTMTLTRIIGCCICLTIGTGLLTAQKQTTGKATYYSDKLHGRKMSNGERYHRDSMTCAHLKYPFGTLLRVKNPLNGKEVIVEVTDRGPFSKRYVIDLSKAAARELGFIRQGFCQVEITKIHPNRIPFKPEGDEEIPELHLEYQDIVTYPVPIWKQDYLQGKKPEPTKIEQHKTDKKQK